MSIMDLELRTMPGAIAQDANALISTTEAQELATERADGRLSDSDRYTEAYAERLESGQATPHDHANAALRDAEQALGVIEGDPDATDARLIADARTAFGNVRKAARVCAGLQERGEIAAAEQAANVARTFAAELRASDERCGESDDRANALDRKAGNRNR